MRKKFTHKDYLLSCLNVIWNSFHLFKIKENNPFFSFSFMQTKNRAFLYFLICFQNILRSICNVARHNRTLFFDLNTSTIPVY